MIITDIVYDKQQQSYNYLQVIIYNDEININNWKFIGCK